MREATLQVRVMAAAGTDDAAAGDASAASCGVIPVACDRCGAPRRS